MNQEITNKKNILNCKSSLFTFSIISLIFISLSSISYFVGYYYDHKMVMRFYFPQFPNIIDMLLQVAPFILLIVCISTFKNKNSTKILLYIIFGLIAVYPFLETILYGYTPDIIELILNVFIFISFGAATYSVATGFNNKIFLIIAVIVGFIDCLYSFIQFAELIEWYIDEELYLYIFTRIFYIIAYFGLYATILILGLKNKISSNSIYGNETDPEQKLKVLYKKLTLGIITSEEYRAQRAEIISKL